MIFLVCKRAQAKLKQNLWYLDRCRNLTWVIWIFYRR